MNTCGRQPAPALLGKIARAGLLPPQRLTVALTTACNLQCHHCWLECPGLTDSPHRVRAEWIPKLIREFVALGGQELCITGGEPLTHPDWLEILVACCAHPLLQRIILQTNGTLLSASVVNILAGTALRNLSFQVSLDGCSEATHELIRGPGSLKMALHGLRRLAAAGCGAQTTIAFTEMRHNMAEIPRLLELAEQFGIAAVVGQPLINRGRAARGEVALSPTPEQYLALLERYAEDARFRERYDKIGSFAAIEWMRGGGGSVHAGCRFLDNPYLTVDGRLFPCALLQADGFAGRGVYERSLAEVIDEALPLWADLLQVSRARTKELACVAGCAGGAHCGGGCLARAYLAGGSLTAREDRCELRQAVYAWTARQANGGR